MAAIDNKKAFVLYVLVAVAVVALANVVSRHWFFRLDLTENRMYSLSPSSKLVLGKVDDLLTAKVYFSDNMPGQYGNARRYLQDILEEYTAYSGGHFRFEFYRPDDDEKLAEEAQKSGIQPVQLQVIENDKMEIKRVYMGMVLMYGDQREVLPVIQTTTGLEYEITTKIKKMVDENRPVVGIATTGRQAPNMERMTAMLRESYAVRSVFLSAGVPDDIALLVVSGVEDSLTTEARDGLKQYIRRGGNVFLAQSRVHGDLQTQMGQVIRTDIFDVLAPFGVSMENNLVLDEVCGNITVSQQRGFLRFNSAVPYPYFPLIQSFPDHDIVNGLSQVQVLFASEISYDPAAGNVVPLLATSQHSSSVAGYINLNPVQNPVFESLNEPGKVVGIYATAPSDSIPGTVSQLVLVSDSEFLTDEGGGQIAENGIFVMNAVDVLIGDKDLVALRSREIRVRPLQVIDEAGKATWKTLNILLPALLVIAYGMVQWRVEAARSRRLEELYG